ncbi:hypothetical protein DYB32_000888 [Aphanomyces invadans]|uniref:Phosphatidylinositol 3-kinase n=1 Tax=Aphanomyces invadans TaxID=157072 RepID=A0A418B8L2_9STRA|nr:hypothetical protein DYB32_000888 [Aphanomyces invadans]
MSDPSGQHWPPPTNLQHDSSDDSEVSSMDSPAHSIDLDSVYETQQLGPSLRSGPRTNIVLPPSTRKDLYMRRESADRSSHKVTWYPVRKLVYTAEHDTMAAAAHAILERVTSRKRMSKEALEVKSTMPEYRLDKADWMLARKRQSDDQLFTIPVVARIPMDVLVLDTTNTSSQNNKRTSCAGYLMKRGEVNVTMQRRYMILQDNELVYYKTNPELNKGWFGKEKPRGSLHLGNVSLVRPYLSTLTIELVTTKRTWVLQAESERDYKMWARAICRSVPYDVVDIVFRRMFQLAEVDASSVNEVRLVTLPSYTVVETVEHIFVNYSQMAGAAPLKPYNPSDFFLKVTGFHDYMVNPSSTMDQYMHIQDCLFSKKTLCLTVLHRNVIVESIQDAIRTDTRRFSAASFSQVRSLPHTPEQVVPSGSYLFPVQFTLEEVQSVNPQGNTHIVVRAELVYNGERLEKVADSAEVHLSKPSMSGQSNGRWSRSKWYNSALNVSALPKETRLVLTVYGFQTTQIEKWTPLATAGVNIFDADNLLIHGDLALPLLHDVPSLYSGPLSRIAQLDDGAPYIVVCVCNPRVYVLAARTRHERDAWMKTIELVASHTDYDLTDTASKDDLRTSLIGQFAKPVGTAQASAELGEFDYLVQLIDENPLYQLCGYEKAILWRHRRAFLGSFEALPRMLTCVNWLDPWQSAEMVALLPSWTTPRHSTSYIALLECVDSRVRQFVVDQLTNLTDTSFRQLIPQLVQALKNEAHHTSPLSALLIERAIKAPNPLGLDLFWALKVETHFPQHRERFGLLLNAYADVCSVKTRAMFELQDNLFGQGGRLEAVCREIKRVKAAGASEKDVLASLHTQLNQVNAWLPTTSYQLPIDSRIQVGKLVVANCRVMSSAKLPLWLEFENAEPGQPSVAVIFKSGDDLRQDALVLQLIRVMDDMWRETGKDLGMEPYRCVATGPNTGLVQVVPHAATTAAIQRRGSSMRGILGAFNLECFSHWIEQHNTTPKALKAAKDLFLRSCAGYCVATHILGIGDRHNDNLMVTRGGRFFHIDFGHFLGFFKYVPLLGIVTIKRERTPFVFTPQMSHVFGGENSAGFAKFIKSGADAFNVVRRHFHAIISLLLLMLPAQLPELRDRDDLHYVVDAIAPELSPQEAAVLFDDLVRQCHSCKWKQYDNAAHLAYHA